MLTVRARVREAEEPVFIPVVSEAHVVMKVWHRAVILREESGLFFWTHIPGSSYLVDNPFTENKKVRLCMVGLVKCDHLRSSYWSLTLLVEVERTLVLQSSLSSLSLQSLPVVLAAKVKDILKCTFGFYIVIRTMWAVFLRGFHSLLQLVVNSYPTVPWKEAETLKEQVLGACA